MRGGERFQEGMYIATLEERVPQDHPWRAASSSQADRQGIAVAERRARYAVCGDGALSIAPEYLLRALLLQEFYSVLSERLLVEQIDYNLRFRWFVGLGMDDAVWNYAVFSKTRTGC